MTLEKLRDNCASHALGPARERMLADFDAAIEDRDRLREEAEMDSLPVLADIRAAVGDADGRLMQPELVEHIRAIVEDRDRLRTRLTVAAKALSDVRAARPGDVDVGRVTGKALSLIGNWRDIAHGMDMPSYWKHGGDCVCGHDPATDPSHDCERCQLLAEISRLRATVKRVAILVGKWCDLEEDWVYDSYESPEKEQGARDAILCAANAVRGAIAGEGGQDDE